MALSVLYIGGTGQISLPCVEASVAAGHKVTVLNRGKTSVPLPKGVDTIVGDMNDAAYGDLGDRHFDVVAQFRLYFPDQMKRDIATFTGKTGQYLFISSASCYQKPATFYVITEKTPVVNPYWKYSQEKIVAETMLREQSKLPWTIVRPSHTVRTGMPYAIGDADAQVRRALRGAPVIVHGDGKTIWTLTRAVDVAKPLVALFGNSRALNDDFHITNDRGITWDEIHDAIGEGLGVKAVHAHVPTDTLIRYHHGWEGPLLGDKAWCAIFDNSKVKGVAGDFTCADDLKTILADSIMHAKRRLDTPLSAAAVAEDALMDRIVADQAKLGA